jgi:hypothetical protein
MTVVMSIIILCIRAIGSNYDHASLIYAIVSGTTAGNEELRFQPLLHLKNSAAQRGPTAMNMMASLSTQVGKRRKRKKKKERNCSKSVTLSTYVPPENANNILKD